jgi:hypothetical protein
VNAGYARIEVFLPAATVGALRHAVEDVLAAV